MIKKPDLFFDAKRTLGTITAPTVVRDSEIHLELRDSRGNLIANIEVYCDGTLDYKFAHGGALSISGLADPTEGIVIEAPNPVQIEHKDTDKTKGVIFCF